MAKYIEKTILLNGDDIALREAVEDDGGPLAEFLAVIGEETPYTYQVPGVKQNVEKLAARLAFENRSETDLRVVALDGASIIGQIWFGRSYLGHPWLDHKGDFSMMIRREWWGSGLATELMSAMESFARANGVTRIQATVNCENERGVHLYAKCGFAIEGIARNYKIVNGRPLDSYYIAKLL